MARDSGRTMTRRVVQVLLPGLLLLFSGCSDNARPALDASDTARDAQSRETPLATDGTSGCAPGQYHYADELCPPPPWDVYEGEPCEPVGDGLCYTKCGNDSDCSVSRPHCGLLGLYYGGDYNCNAAVSICRESDGDDCLEPVEKPFGW